MTTDLAVQQLGASTGPGCVRVRRGAVSSCRPREEVRRVFAERDPKPAKRDGSLYGNDGVKRTPGFKPPKDR